MGFPKDLILSAPQPSAPFVRSFHFMSGPHRVQESSSSTRQAKVFPMLDELCQSRSAIHVQNLSLEKSGVSFRRCQVEGLTKLAKRPFMMGSYQFNRIWRCQSAPPGRPELHAQCKMCTKAML